MGRNKFWAFSSRTHLVTLCANVSFNAVKKKLIGECNSAWIKEGDSESVSTSASASAALQESIF
jgi:hypothetical protein